MPEMTNTAQNVLYAVLDEVKCAGGDVFIGFCSQRGTQCALGSSKNRRISRVSIRRQLKTDAEAGADGEHEGVLRPVGLEDRLGGFEIPRDLGLDI